MTTPDIAPLWERLAGEPPKAYAAFCVYRDMGPERTVDKAYTLQRYGTLTIDKRVTHSWRDWSATYKWLHRAKEYDAYQDRIRREAEEKATSEAAAKWARRREEQRQRELEASDALFKRAQELLQIPTTRRTVRGKDGTTIIEPARWKQSDIATMLKLSSDLGRRAAGMETERIASEVAKPGGEDLDRLGKYSDEDLDAIIASAPREEG